MTDRELLELAAKAAGIKWLPATTEKGIELEPKFGLWLVIDGEPNEYQRRRWNPLTDDGDALRLAVKLRLVVLVWAGAETVSAAKTLPDGEDPSPISDDWQSANAHACDGIEAATRRAIVRAAAEIGRGMGNEQRTTLSPT